MDIKSVYSMSADELKRAFRRASRERVSSPKYWDALMYRSSVLRSTFSLNEISWITDSLTVCPKFSSQIFLNHLVDPLPTKGRTVMDAAMILRSVRRLSPGDEELILKLESEIQSIIFEKLTNTISFRDLTIIARLLCGSRRIDSNLSQRIRSIISNKKPETVSCQSSVLTILKFLISSSPSSESHVVDTGDEEPFFDSTDPLDESGPQIELLKSWFSQSIVLSQKFNAKDSLDFALCVHELIKSNMLTVLGHPSPGPICSVISRGVARNVKLFKIDQLVQLLLVGIEIEKKPIENEVQYRIRQLNYRNTLKLLVSYSGDLRDPLLARLHRFDCIQSMTVPDLVLIGTQISTSSDLGKSLLKACLPVALKGSPSEVPQVVELYEKMGLKKELENTVTRRRSHLVNR